MNKNKQYHATLVKSAKDAIDRVFGDTTVGAATTRSDLYDISDHINMLIESLAK